MLKYFSIILIISTNFYISSCIQITGLVKNKNPLIKTNPESGLNIENTRNIPNHIKPIIYGPPIKKKLTIEDVQCNAKYSAMLLHQNGKILFENRADKIIFPASLAKLMTTYLTFEALKRLVNWNSYYFS